LLAMSSCSDDDTDSTESDGESDSELYCDVGLRIEHEVESLDSVDLDGHVGMARDGDEDEQEDQGKDVEVEVEEENEENGKEPQMIGQGEMVNIPSDDADTMVDEEPPVLP